MMHHKNELRFYDGKLEFYHGKLRKNKGVRVLAPGESIATINKSTNKDFKESNEST